MWCNSPSSRAAIRSSPSIFGSQARDARARGATHCINAGKTTDVAAAMPRDRGRQGTRQGDETTGVKGVIEMAYDLTHADGTCVLVGVPHEKVSISTLPIHFNKVLTGSHGGDARPHVDIPRIIRDGVRAGAALLRRHHHA